jgi:hypothetical protein
MPKLSIIIPTRDRSEWLRETLATVTPQLRDGVELVIVDASKVFPDPQVAALKSPHLRYERGSAGNFDAAYDEAVSAARGDWVWLFSDDDWFKPGAVDAALAALNDAAGLLIVNTEVRDVTMQRVLLPKWVDRPTQDYPAADYDRMFVQLADLGTFVGSTLLRRQLWVDRVRESKHCFGTRFLTFIIPFAKPTPARFLSDVLVSARLGHQGWIKTMPQLIGQTLAEVVWSFPLTEASKHAVRPKRPRTQELLFWRAAGCDISMHSKSLNRIPPPLAKAAVRLGLKLKGRSGGVSDYMLGLS